MKYLYLLVIVPLLMFCHAEGRIGETLAQCKARYGEPVRHEDGIWEFKKNKVVVALKVKDDKCNLIIYSMDGGFTPDQIVKLARINSPGNEGDWEEAEVENPVAQAAMRNPGAKVSLLLFDDGDVLIATFEAAAEAKKQEAEALEGL